MLLLNYRVHQATVQRHVKMNQEESQKHRPLVFLAGLLLVKEYATYRYVKFHTGSEI
jgi:hypothetical protein